MKRSVKHKLNILFTILTILFACAFLFGCADDGVIFYDDFDSLDLSVWNVYSKKTETDGWGAEDGIRRGGYWDKSQAFVRDGNLVIRTSLLNGRFFTGAIDTNGKFANSYGYYEAKVFLPRASGLWSAFWIMCNKMGAPSTDAKISGTELDIFESPYYNKYDGSGFFQSAIHIGDYGEHYFTDSFISAFSKDTAITSINPYDGWHVFSLDWRETGYRFFCDGILTWQTDCNDNVSDADSYLFLSVEIPGENGVPGKSPFFLGGAMSDNDASIFASPSYEGYCESDFLVDYVKVLKKCPFDK
ncbi:MAG: family 16 glycosylhydrolase [Christensenellales bacterium]